MQALSTVEGADPLDGGIPHQRGCEFPLGDDVSLLNLLETPNWLRGARLPYLFSHCLAFSLEFSFSWLVVHPEASCARGPVQWAMTSQRRRSHIVRLRARRGERNGGAHVPCELFPRLGGSLSLILLLLMLRLWLFGIVGRSVFLKR